MSRQRLFRTRKKNNAFPASNRMNIPLELVDEFNWRDTEPREEKPFICNVNAEASVDRYLDIMHPVFSHMILFGTDYHNFMDRNDPIGLLEY